MSTMRTLKQEDHAEESDGGPIIEVDEDMTAKINSLFYWNGVVLQRRGVQASGAPQPASLRRQAVPKEKASSMRLSPLTDSALEELAIAVEEEQFVRSRRRPPASVLQMSGA